MTGYGFSVTERVTIGEEIEPLQSDTTRKN